jgi:hypothetical protein
MQERSAASEISQRDTRTFGGQERIKNKRQLISTIPIIFRFYFHSPTIFCVNKMFKLFKIINEDHFAKKKVVTKFCFTFEIK